MGFLTQTKDIPESPKPYTGQRWEYATLNLNFKASLAFEDEFNKLGQQGWEFVAMAMRDKIHRAVFKRPL